MSTTIHCDGCLCDLTRPPGPEVSGQRRENSGGAGIPNGEFHLCLLCAVVAFHAAATQPHPINYPTLAGETYAALNQRRLDAARATITATERP